jgi:hypothetical protein
LGPIKRAPLFFLLAVWLLIFPPRAFAYLDPGTGSLIVQSVIAAVAAAGFAVRLYWRRIRAMFRGNRAGVPSDEPMPRPPQP